MVKILEVGGGGVGLFVIAAYTSASDNKWMQVSMHRE